MKLADGKTHRYSIFMREPAKRGDPPTYYLRDKLLRVEYDEADYDAAVELCDRMSRPGDVPVGEPRQMPLLEVRA